VQHLLAYQYRLTHLSLKKLCGEASSPDSSKATRSSSAKGPAYEMGIWCRARPSPYMPDTTCSTARLSRRCSAVPSLLFGKASLGSPAASDL
jgi:hypothetical protein